MRAPRSRSCRESVADSHIVARVKPVGNFVEESGVLVVRDQAISHSAIFIADIEPDSRAVIGYETAFLQNNAARQDDFVAAGFPLAVKTFGVVVANRATGEKKIVGAHRCKTELPVILKSTIPRDLIGGAKARS